MRSHVRARCTLTADDSFDCTDAATFDHCRHVICRIAAAEEAARAVGARKPYVEVQIHGPVRLCTDVAALVLDGGHRNNPEIALAAERFSAKFCVPVQYTR